MTDQDYIQRHKGQPRYGISIERESVPLSILRDEEWELTKAKMIAGLRTMGSMSVDTTQLRHPSEALSAAIDLTAAFLAP